MTLPAWYNLVKLPHAWRNAIWASGTLVWLAAFVGWQLAHQNTAQADRYGALTAASIATLARTPLLKQDRIELGLISNRMKDLPGVTGITIVGVDEQVLSTTAQQASGREFSHPIALDDAVIGYARVTVDPATVAPQPIWPWLTAGVLALAMPWLFQIVTLMVAGAATRRARQAEKREAATTATVAPQPTANEPISDLYVVVANLLNQFGLSPAQRQQALVTAQAVAHAVAEPHDGSIEALGDTGLAVWFRDDQTPGYPLQLLHSALLLTRLLPTLENTGSFRIAMHRRPADAAHLEPEALRVDAALMSAAAGASQVILSSACSEVIPAETLDSANTITHPLGSDFQTADAQCRRIERLASEQELQLTERLVALGDQFGSTDSESTF